MADASSPGEAIDRDALAAAHVRHAMRFAARACVLYGIERLTDEAQSEAMVVLVESSREWRDIGNPFSTYLFSRIRSMVRWRFARHAGRDAAGSYGGRTDHESDTDGGRASLPETAVDHRPGPVESCERAETLAGLSRARMRLSRDQAKVIRFRYDLGPPRKGGGAMGDPQVAKAMGRDARWVRRTENAAIAKLRELMTSSIG